MITGQILVYHYNGLHNAKPDAKRDIHSLRNVSVENNEGFRKSIEDALDGVPPGRGYALVKWSDRMFICEKDSNNPELNYVRHEISYHPLMNLFSQQ